MDRVLVVGACGSGKTTFGRALATRLGAPFIEGDALYHGENWVPRPTFQEDVDRATQPPAWVVDGNYSAVRDLLWSRADTVVWLDLPLWLLEWRLVRRSFARWITREELWSGNREPSPLGWIDPEHPVRWAWKRHAEYRVQYSARFEDAAWTRLRRERLRTREDVSGFLLKASRGP